MTTLPTAHSRKRPALVTTTFSNSRGGRLRERRLYFIRVSIDSSHTISVRTQTLTLLPCQNHKHSSLSLMQAGNMVMALKINDAFPVEPMIPCEVFIFILYGPGCTRPNSNICLFLALKVFAKIWQAPIL